MIDDINCIHLHVRVRARAIYVVVECYLVSLIRKRRQKGDHFKPHIDTEKTDGIIAALSIVLPCVCILVVSLLSTGIKLLLRISRSCT